LYPDVFISDSEELVQSENEIEVFLSAGFLYGDVVQAPGKYFLYAQSLELFKIAANQNNETGHGTKQIPLLKYQLKILTLEMW
jgi:hypothetical protein